ncbi:MFS transporter [Candidatus Enterovibrio altilux]|uniref:MFS transporter n=1 Tax=Candidatus Enterovibrio altilux TaxID=1927128 RepID=UPI000BBC3AF1
MSGVEPILDATAIPIKKTGHPYGKMRIYGSVGILSACLLTGWLIEHYSIDIALPVVSLLYVFIGIMTITCLPNTPNENKTELEISTKKYSIY